MAACAGPAFEGAAYAPRPDGKRLDVAALTELGYALFFDTGLSAFNDLPERYHIKVNVEPPFDRKPGDAPALNEEEIADVIAFLKTLTDADLAAR